MRHSQQNDYLHLEIEIWSYYYTLKDYRYEATE